MCGDGIGKNHLLDKNKMLCTSKLCDNTMVDKNISSRISKHMMDNNAKIKHGQTVRFNGGYH